MKYGLQQTTTGIKRGLRQLAAGLMLCCLSLGLQAQFANDWIDYSRPYLKIRTTANAVHRIDSTVLSEHVAAAGYSLASVDPADFRMYYQGQEIPLYVEGESDGSFDGSDFIEFLGLRNDGSLDTLLYASTDLMLHWDFSLYADTAAFFLTWTDGLPGLRWNDRNNDLSGAPTPDSWLDFTVSNAYNAGWNFIQGPDIANVFSSSMELGEGFADPEFNASSISKTVSTPSVYTPMEADAEYYIVIAGEGPNTHRMLIDINSNPEIDESFSGYGIRRFEGDFTASASNTFDFTAGGPDGTDRQQLSLIRVRYARESVLGGSSWAKFRINDQPASDRLLGIKSFSTGGSEPILYHPKNGWRMVGINSADSSYFRIDEDVTGDEVILGAQAGTGLRNVTELEVMDFVDLSSPSNQGDFLIVTHPLLQDDGYGQDWVAAYRDHKNSIAGGGFNARIIDVNQLYDQFGYGIEKHPVALRHFAEYATQAFDEPARYLFLIGKAYVYNRYRAGGALYEETLIPTFGHPGSDVLLTAPRGSIVPQIAMGRLAAQDAEDVRIYYDKMVAYDAVRTEPDQSVEAKHWTKNIMHFGGGISEFEQNAFRGYLGDYEEIVRDTLYGGSVYNFYKTSTDPVTDAPSEKIDSLLLAGTSLITFFGHSSINSFDYNIGDPDDFVVNDKYPVVFGNGCVTGEIHNSTRSLSEDYIFSEGAGAIGFIAASTFSFAAGLDVLAEEIYEQWTYDSYNEGLGQNIMDAIAAKASGAGTTARMAMEHSTLHGDPSLTLNSHPQPDYAIETPFVLFDPPVVTVADDSFDVHLIVHNLGMAVDTAYFIKVERVLPDGSTTEQSLRFPTAVYKDTVTFRFATESLEAVGTNSLNIRIDDLDEIEEIDEFNNNLSVDWLVVSDDAIPVFPYDFAIASSPVDHLSASTANVFAPERQYVIQLDTTEQFNSPLFAERKLTQIGGVITWDNPTMSWIDSTVYYWRISLDTLYDNEFGWRNRSFVYREGSEPGWNQSHFYQFRYDNYNNMGLEDDRVFRFVDDVHVIDIFTGGVWWSVVGYYDNSQVAFSACAGQGFVSMVVDPANGELWRTNNMGTGFGQFGDVYCGGDPSKPVIQWSTANTASREALYNFMVDTVPAGHYFIAYTTLFDPLYSQWGDDNFGPDSNTLFDAFALYGAEIGTVLDTFSYPPSYIFFGRKSFPEDAQEVWETFDGEILDAHFDVPGTWIEGYFTTPKIGPAQKWNTLLWDSKTIDPISVDERGVSLIGVRNSGAEEIIASDISLESVDLSFVDTEEYPYLKLRMDTRDDSLRTPTQLQYWTVLFDPVPEAALNPSAHFVISDDTLGQGENFSLEIAVDNIGELPMDSLLIRFAVIDQNNITHEVDYPRQDSLRVDDRLISSIELDTREFPTGNNRLLIDVNPNNDQPEETHFNNVGLIPFRVSGDRIDPFLDVTFDGIHIIDGDIVSARPEILIRLTDENPYLALDDTSLFDLRLVYPDASVLPLRFDDPILRFTPADASDLEAGNSAEIELSPELLMDGIYRLEVTAEDASGNSAGDIEYRINFEVINESMISNVVNYPNPFTTQTQFVFTLTGSQIPEEFRIQIMTVSGKVIRQIDQTELGPVHIGHNRTDFRWDGTDQFGDPVANGLYLYRVMVRLNGEELDHYSTGSDRYFENGWGKMYLAR